MIPQETIDQMDRDREKRDKKRLLVELIEAAIAFVNTLDGTEDIEDLLGGLFYPF